MASTPSALVPDSSFAQEMRRQLAVLPLRPGLALFSGHPQSSRLSHYFLAAPLLRGEAVLFLDAANCFDPYRIVAMAQKWRRFPPELLRRVRVSRAFTCFQMAELIERTARAARRYGARCIVLTGFPDIFDDEEISPAEAKSVFVRALAVLRGWRALRLAALAFSDLSPQPTPLGAWLAQRLAREAAVYRFEETATGLALRAIPLRSLRLCGETSRASFGSYSPQRRKVRGEGESHGADDCHFSSVDRADPGALR